MSSPGSPNGEISVPGPRSLGYWLRIAAVVGIACIRVEIYREVTLKVECAAGGYHVSLRAGYAMQSGGQLTDACLFHLVCDPLFCFTLRLLAQPTSSTSAPEAFPAPRQTSEWEIGQDIHVHPASLLVPVPGAYKICHFGSLPSGWRIRCFVIQ